SQLVADTPGIDGLAPLSRYVDGDRTVALFEVARAGTYLLEVRGATADDHGGYLLHIDVAGDVNADGKVDGQDSQALAAAYGSLGGETAYVAAADIDDDGAVAAGDRLLLAHNYGFAAGGAPTLSDPFAAGSPNVYVGAPGGSGGGTGGGSGGGSG